MDSLITAKGKWLPHILAMVALFALLNYMGSALYHRAGGVTTVKPFSGVALAICLIYGPRSLWPVLITGMIGGMFAKQMFGSSLADTIMTPGLASLSILATYFLTRRLVGSAIDLRAWKQLVGFISIACLVSAVSGVAFAGNRYMFLSPGFNANWQAWWIPTTLSYVIFTPVIVLLATAQRQTVWDNRFRIAGSLALLVAALAVTFVPTSVPLMFIVPLALLIVTMISEIEGTAIGLVVTQAVYTAAIVAGHGPSAVAELALGNQLYFAQAFLGILIMVLLPVAAAVTERRKFRDRLTAALEREAKINNVLRDNQQRYREMAERERSASRAKSEFLAGMSHELRTPLNAVLGFTEVLKAELFGPLGHEKYREYADDVYKSGAHLLDLINDMLDLSKIDAGKMELRESTFAIPELVSEAMLLIREKARGHAELSVCLPDVLPQITADKRLLKQILLNLLSNAVKFTPKGGVIGIGAAQMPDGALGIFVADTGIGMTAEELEIAFSHYGQVDSKVARAHQGTGLGLPISRALARLHGGDLIGESVSGGGTRMTLLLPRERVSSSQDRNQGPSLLARVAG